jgi:hypothetical protein
VVYISIYIVSSFLELAKDFYPNEVSLDSDLDILDPVSVLITTYLLV